MVEYYFFNFEIRICIDGSNGLNGISIIAQRSGGGGFGLNYPTIHSLKGERAQHARYVGA
jgi:hypothetical protein